MPAPSSSQPAPAAPEASVHAPKLQAALRDLWHGHIVHARDYALAVHAHKDADAKQAADAVVANARQISAVAGFYGKAGGDRMMALLAGHWGKAVSGRRIHHMECIVRGGHVCRFRIGDQAPHHGSAEPER